MPQLHKIKIKQCYYEEIERGVKTFELRKNDRNYQVDDILQFQVIRDDGAILEPGGFYQITYILSKCPEYGLQDGYVILGIKNEGKEHLERIAKELEEEKQKRKNADLLETIECFKQHAFIRKNSKIGTEILVTLHSNDKDFKKVSWVFDIIK